MLDTSCFLGLPFECQILGVWVTRVSPIHKTSGHADVCSERSRAAHHSEVCFVFGILSGVTQLPLEKELNITVCLGSSCFARGNEERLNFIEKYVEENNLDAKIDITGSRCEGKCAQGPNITINGKLYSNITDEKLKEILDKVRG